MSHSCFVPSSADEPHQAPVCLLLGLASPFLLTFSLRFQFLFEKWGCLREWLHLPGVQRCMWRRGSSRESGSKGGLVCSGHAPTEVVGAPLSSRTGRLRGVAVERVALFEGLTFCDSTQVVCRGLEGRPPPPPRILAGVVLPLACPSPLRLVASARIPWLTLFPGFAPDRSDRGAPRTGLPARP